MKLVRADLPVDVPNAKQDGSGKKNDSLESEKTTRTKSSKTKKSVILYPDAVRKHPLAKCEMCPLYPEPMVPGIGADKAKYVIVGEAPSDREVEIGRPFVGRSGQLLRTVLNEYGVSEDNCYVTNTCLCRPPGNRNPKAAEIRACQDRLHDEIRSREPELILALGNYAAKPLTGKGEGITKLRVYGKQPSVVDNIPVACTFHPAAGLRNPDNVPSIFQDIEKAIKSPSGSASVTWQPTNYRVITDPNTAVRAISELSRYPELAIDIEVCAPDGESHGKPDSFRYLCVGVSYERGKAVVFDDTCFGSQQFKTAFSEMLVRSRGIYHNGKFDIQYLRSIEPRTVVSDDTMLMHYALDERKGTHDLEQVAVTILGAPMWKTEAKGELAEEERSLAYLPKDKLHLYNAQDVDITLRLAHAMRPRLAQEGTERPYTVLMVPASNVLADVESRGIRVDIDRLDATQEEFVYALQEMRKYFDAKEINPNSNPQVVKALQEMGFNVMNNQAETLERLPANEFVANLLEYKKRNKVQTTYLQGLRKHIRNGRIHPQYKLHGTETGRLSASKPNIQNQPREHGIRDMFVADPGKIFVQADYSAIELRLAAAFSGDPYLTEVFKEGRSPHKELAEEIYGVNYTKEQYVNVKTVNFGTLYLESAKHLAFRQQMSVQDAEKLQRRFYERSPYIRAYQQSLRQEFREQGYLTSMWGRRRRFWLITDQNLHDLHKEACNFPLQGAASDFNLQAMIKLDPILNGVAEPVITVHDSLTYQCDNNPETIQYVMETMQEVMEDEVNGVPLTVEFQIGASWGSLEDIS